MATPSVLSTVTTVQLRIWAADGRQETAEITVPGERELHLPSGITYVGIVSNTLWSGEQALNIAPGSVNSFPLDVWPAGVIRGRFADMQEKPASIMLFVQTTGREGKRIIPCDLDRDSWACTVPMGVHDIRLRVPGFISHYFWAVQIAGNSNVNVGTITLRPGSSVVGRVTTADPTDNDVEAPTVSLRPEAIPAGVGEAPYRRASTMTARVNDRGFFHFDGVAPGRYKAVATRSGFARAIADVLVVEGRESELAETLMLYRPRSLTVRVAMPLDPDHERWRVVLEQEGDRPGSFETVTEDTTGANGEWRWRGPKATYRVNIGPSNGDTWASETLLLDRDMTIERSLFSVPIRGSVRMAGKGLRATMQFVHETGPSSTVRSDANGEFTGALPPLPDRKWRVSIENEHLSIDRQFDVVVPEDGELAIDLPGGRLAGSVTDTEGRPIERGFVNVLGNGELIQAAIDASATYAVEGLPAGRYTIEVSEGAVEGGPVAIEVQENTDDRLDLVVRRADAIRGTVFSTASGPIAGATVHVFPLQPAIFASRDVTAVDGTFAAAVPGGTEHFDIAVSAHGFARRFFRGLRKPGSPMSIDVSQDGGTLLVEIPDAEFKDRDASRAFLFHRGARIPVAFVGTFWGRFSPSSRPAMVRLSAHQMEPGDYSLCVIASNAIFDAAPIANGPCASGILPPYGELTLSLGKAE
jgi:hypothetical protein